MELKEGQKYKVVVGKWEGEFAHSFTKNSIVEYTGSDREHFEVGMIYRFKSETTRNWLKKEWVIPVKNTIKKLGG